MENKDNFYEHEIYFMCPSKNKLARRNYDLARHMIFFNFDHDAIQSVTDIPKKEFIFRIPIKGNFPNDDRFKPTLY